MYENNDQSDSVIELKRDPSSPKTLQVVCRDVDRGVIDIVQYGRYLVTNHKYTSVSTFKLSVDVNQKETACRKVSRTTVIDTNRRRR